ncbi:MAG: type IV pilus biogenesis/stability protein PilW [Candidatus Sedimenticola endophacoides]|uniref:Type IV pilus biogenesis/stability protein PilW n=1 Tax=Candidatus Sedimenticola endophacoides TaxID=2548426 RepID=A0A6N4DUW9_9GAMM|nr:MAG: type IV pilus biogenesis/stability protein PilW [Candidatus Sedimenticola endophacoides]PUE02081.1 MAG: type IV pilus biogenesis/stability protein PilW [Candidatus Sedimenticola endophacoides]PUE04035.1 MAG: type IV pilus biogenesis/stability protein PilW [Candidatus Sedimenticola endophacoides]
MVAARLPLPGPASVLFWRRTVKQINTLLVIAVVLLLLGGCQSTPSRPGGGVVDLEDSTGEMGEAVQRTGAGDIYVRLAVAYLNEGRLDVALQKAKTALQVEPGNAEAHNVVALIYGRLGEKGLAERHYREGLNIRPRNSYLRNAYGTFLCQEGRFDEADQQFSQALENPLYQTPEVALSNAGICARRIPDDSRAERYLRRALEANPRFAPALIQMGQLSYDNGDHLMARGYLQRYQAVAQATAASLWLGIRTERELGDRNAVASYSMALRNNYPDSREAQLLRESE